MDDHPRAYSVWMEGTAMAKANDPLEALRENPNAAALLSRPELLSSLLQSPETQNLIRLLERQSGDALRKAAGEAARGDPTALKGVVDQLMGSKDGAQAIQALQHRVKP